jgi:hypothetical protein
MRKVHVLAATTGFVLVLSIAWYSRGPVAAQEKPAQGLQKWEYKVETVNTVALFQEEKKFTKLGSEGWELCATERNGEKEGVSFIIFKRPKR